MAATQGVYNRQNTSRLAAASGVIAAKRFAVSPNRTEIVDTTLSFAMKPVISAVEILQSPNPSGVNTGAITPATMARMLFCESVTTFSLVSKVCRNHIAIDARKITVNALCRKSFAFSHKSCDTFLMPGIL